jgi:hypothetical protein
MAEQEYREAYFKSPKKLLNRIGRRATSASLSERLAQELPADGARSEPWAGTASFFLQGRGSMRQRQSVVARSLPIRRSGA